jgi:hypothetical protein
MHGGLPAVAAAAVAGAGAPVAGTSRAGKSRRRSAPPEKRQAQLASERGYRKELVEHIDSLRELVPDCHVAPDDSAMPKLDVLRLTVEYIRRMQGSGLGGGPGASSSVAAAHGVDLATTTAAGSSGSGNNSTVTNATTSALLDQIERLRMQVREQQMAQYWSQRHIDDLQQRLAVATAGAALPSQSQQQQQQLVPPMPAGGPALSTTPTPAPGVTLVLADPSAVMAAGAGRPASWLAPHPYGATWASTLDSAAAVPGATPGPPQAMWLPAWTAMAANGASFPTTTWRPLSVPGPVRPAAPTPGPTNPAAVMANGVYVATPGPSGAADEHTSDGSSSSVVRNAAEDLASLRTVSI